MSNATPFTYIGTGWLDSSSPFEAAMEAHERDASVRRDRFLIADPDDYVQHGRTYDDDRSILRVAICEEYT